MKNKKILDKIAIKSSDNENIGRFLIEIFKKEVNEELNQWKKEYENRIKKHIEG